MPLNEKTLNERTHSISEEEQRYIRILSTLGGTIIGGFSSVCLGLWYMSSNNHENWIDNESLLALYGASFTLITIGIIAEAINNVLLNEYHPPLNKGDVTAINNQSLLPKKNSTKAVTTKRYHQSL